MQFWWICGFGAYWELFARGGVVLHGNLQVKWKPTHNPQQNFQFWWICGFGAYWELFAKGGVVLHGNLQVKWKSNHVPRRGSAVLVGLRWGSLF